MSALRPSRDRGAYFVQDTTWATGSSDARFVAPGETFGASGEIEAALFRNGVFGNVLGTRRTVKVVEFDSAESRDAALGTYMWGAHDHPPRVLEAISQTIVSATKRPPPLDVSE